MKEPGSAEKGRGTIVVRAIGGTIKKGSATVGGAKTKWYKISTEGKTRNSPVIFAKGRGKSHFIVGLDPSRSKFEKFEIAGIKEISGGSLLVDHGPKVSPAEIQRAETSAEKMIKAAETAIQKIDQAILHISKRREEISKYKTINIFEG